MWKYSIIIILVLISGCGRVVPIEPIIKSVVQNTSVDQGDYSGAIIY